MLEKEIQFYRKNQADLLERFKGRWLVITGETIHGDYETNAMAYEAGVKELGLGHFLIQLVEEENKLIRRFYSRVYV